MTDRFRAGDVCLLIDSRGRRYLLDLTPGHTFQYHAGSLRHDEVIDAEPGIVLRSTAGAGLIAVRPRLTDYLLNMKRGAQIVYPKDLGPIIQWGDIAPGHLVVEAGTGSGALTMALLRAVGPGGRVISVERRSDHLDHARKAMTRFLGELPANLDLREGEVQTVLESESPDRIVLDLPEPWEVAEPAGRSLAAGGVLTAYLPTVPQVNHLHDALRRTGRFAAVETFETLIRDWRISGRSVRPASTMVGHTGFITTAFRTVGGIEDDA